MSTRREDAVQTGVAGASHGNLAPEAQTGFAMCLASFPHPKWSRGCRGQRPLQWRSRGLGTWLGAAPSASTATTLSMRRNAQSIDGSSVSMSLKGSGPAARLPSGNPCARPCRPGRGSVVQVPPSLLHAARSGASEPSPALLDVCQLPSPSLLSMPLPTQDPFPRQALPCFIGTTDPSAILPARPAPRGVPVAICTAPAGLPVFHATRYSMHASTTTPVSPNGACAARFPFVIGLPLDRGGSTLTLTVSRPARRSLAFRPAWSLNRPAAILFVSVLQPASLPLQTALTASEWSSSFQVGFTPTRLT